MMAYIKPQQRKEEECEKLRGERDQIKFIDLRFERWQVLGLRKARRKQEESKMFRKLHVIGKNGDLLGRVRRLGSET